MMKFLQYYFGLLVCCSSFQAFSCPLCNADTGQEVREGIFNADFLYYFFCSLLPFIVFAFIAFLSHKGFYSHFFTGKNGNKPRTNHDNQ